MTSNKVGLLSTNHWALCAAALLPILASWRRFRMHAYFSRTKDETFAIAILRRDNHSLATLTACWPRLSIVAHFWLATLAYIGWPIQGFRPLILRCVR